MSDMHPIRRSKAPFVVFLLMGAVAIFGAILWSANGSLVSPRAEVPDEAKQLRHEWNQQSEAIQGSLKSLQVSQQKLASEMDDLKRQIAREGGERKLLSDQVGSLSARVDGLAEANASATERAAPRKRQ
jgi:hypothetical protein